MQHLLTRHNEMTTCLGRSPYPGMAPQCIMTDLKNGYRMPKPEGCPDEM